MIRKPIWILIWMLFSLNLVAVNYDMIWVGFTDKSDSKYSLNRPHEFLSIKAIERRQKQKIPIDIYDIPISKLYLDSVLKDPSLELYYTSRWFNGAMFKSSGSSETINRLKELGFVSFIELTKSISTAPIGNKSSQQSIEIDFNMQLVDDSKLLFSGLNPFSPSLHRPWHSGYGATENQISMLNGQSLHENGFWGNGITIAVLDGGYRSVDTMKAFENLWQHNKILGYYDFVDAREQLYQGHAHGTYVLSVMAASVPGEYAGVAPDASYWLIRTEDAASEFRIEEYNWLAGAEFADSVGADIINSSLGYTVFDDVTQNYTYADLNGITTVVSRAANMAFSRGMLVVNSAGNYGTQPWRYIGSPADATGVLAVGATDNRQKIASFSSVGPSSDGRIKPQVLAQGQGVAIVNYLGTISNANGTSFSSPLIAGLSACLWERFPDATNEQIKNAIIRSGDRFLKPDSVYGYGIANFKIATSLLEKQLDDSQFIKLSRNPLIPESSLSFYAQQQEMISIDIINSSGQKVWVKDNITVMEGFNEIKPFTDIYSLASGMYLIRVRFKNKSELIKTIKL
jgi:serine protease AprX